MVSYISYIILSLSPPLYVGNDISIFDTSDAITLWIMQLVMNSDASLLCGQKIVVPSDTPKKNLANCGLALQYLRQAGVSLHDEDGMMIVADDIVSGDKELTLSLLWNMFVHLQVVALLLPDSLNFRNIIAFGFDYY